MREFLRKLWRDGGDSLERWTNEQLDRQPPESLEGAQALLSRVLDQQDLPETLRDVAAQWLDNIETLRNHENDLTKTAQWLAQGPGPVETPKRGRPKGSAPGLTAANTDVARIEALWKRAFGMVSPQSPSAVKIAAHRHGVNPDQLENYRKNRSKVHT